MRLRTHNRRRDRAHRRQIEHEVRLRRRMRVWKVTRKRLRRFALYMKGMAPIFAKVSEQLRGFAASPHPAGHVGVYVGDDQ